jgi:hypothetical protein
VFNQHLHAIAGKDEKSWHTSIATADSGILMIPDGVNVDVGKSPGGQPNGWRDRINAMRFKMKDRR